MGHKMIDAYKTLGIPKDADESAVKKAFRRLARKYHPDTSKDPNAESKFKEVNEAQSILSDPQEKMKHDIHNGYVTNPNSHSGFPFGNGGIDDFFSEMFGNNPFHAHRRQHRQQRPIMTVAIELSLEEIYSGVTKLLSINNRQLEVEIPPGCENGEVFLIDVEGSQLRLQVHERRHPTVNRDGLNLHKEVRVPIDIAILGGELKVELLGAIKTVNIPPMTGSHKIIRVRGEGIKTRESKGDLHLGLRINIDEKSVSRLKMAWS